MEENKEMSAEELEKDGQTVVEDAELNPDTDAEQCDEAESEKSSCKEKDKKKTKKLEAELEALRAELASEQDKYTRLYAEYDNFRKRSAKERESVYGDAYCDALTQLLPVLDNMERAAQFTADDADSPMAKGLELTLKSLVETMNKMGIYEIEALGKEFDPNLHNAVMHVEDETVGENVVVEVFMKGYAKGDKVLRYAMVKVAN